MNRRRKLKINSSIERDTSNLPCDIIQDILSRLPVKSLLRFKSVCKPWYSLICDSKFARIHLLQSKKNPHFGTLYVSQFRDPQFYFLNFTNLDFELEKIEFPIKKYTTAFCSCDGLILLNAGNDKMCVIWNPSTRTYTKFTCCCKISYLSHRYGLCYDASSDDYKFVLLISDSAYVVYSYKSNSWSEEKELPLECRNNMNYSVNRGPGLFVNGALHWVTTKDRTDSDSTNVKEGSPIYEWKYREAYELCCFDPKDDNFKKMSTPMCFDKNSRFNLTDLGGQLCLYTKTFDLGKLDIWMMEDYGDFDSWTKFLTIKIWNVPCTRSILVAPLCLTNKRDVVLYVNNSRIVVYNEENSFRAIHIPGGESGDILKQDVMRRGFRGDKVVFDPLFGWNTSLVFPYRIIKN